MSELANQTDWVNLFKDKPAEYCYDQFLFKYKEICDKSIPLLKHNVLKKRAPWITNEIISLTKEKKALAQESRFCLEKCFFSRRLQENQTAN